jgi:hypothetical protein
MWSPVLLSGGDSGIEATNGVAVVGVDDPVGLADHVGRITGAHGWLVIGMPQGLADAGRTAVTIAAGCHPTARIAWFVSSHNPLGIFAALASSVLQQEEPGRGVSLVRGVLDLSWSATVLSSVAGLTSPAPTVRQHLLSYLPGSSFVVRHDPHPAVLGSRGADLVRGLPNPRMPRLLLSEAGAPSAVVEAVQHAGAPVASRQFETPGDWSPLFGKAKAHQLALLPDATHVVLDALRPCPSCGVQVTMTQCPFCRIQTRERKVAAPVQRSEPSLFDRTTGGVR